MRNFRIEMHTNYSEHIVDRFAFFVLIITLTALTSRDCLGDDESEIRQAIVTDSSMMAADFESFARQATKPDRTLIEDQSLTLVLLTLDVQDSLKAREQFRFLKAPHPKPSELADELYRTKKTGKRVILLQPITFIHADRITDLTCEVKDDAASGSVSFKVPELYQGKVDYKARKHEGRWYVVEFGLPAYSMSVAIGNDGQWKMK
jgi:hypothetical protein